MGRGGWLAALLATIVASGSLACVANERRNAMKARDAYRACLEEHPGSPGACDGLKARYEAEVRIYEERSHRAWACDPAQEECPTPR